jgi:hypothetical protein
MSNIIDPADKKLFNKIGTLQNEMKETLVRLLMTEVELEASRGNPDRFRGYRKTVLTWMRDNVPSTDTDTDKSKPKRVRTSEYKVEFEFERKNQKKQRTAYPEEPVKIPVEILQAAFLSGQNNRLYQTRTQEGTELERVMHDSNRVSGMVTPR